MRTDRRTDRIFSVLTVCFSVSTEYVSRETAICTKAYRCFWLVFGIYNRISDVFRDDRYEIFILPPGCTGNAEDQTECGAAGRITEFENDAVDAFLKRNTVKMFVLQCPSAYRAVFADECTVDPKLERSFASDGDIDLRMFLYRATKGRILGYIMH